jgi:uncharacterized LabA/DUF88 family protein
LQAPRLCRPAVRYYTQGFLAVVPLLHRRGGPPSGGCRSGGAIAPPALLAGFAFSGAWSPVRETYLAETKLKIAVFIDFDNIEIGVKTTLGSHFDAGAVLEAIKERGDVVTKIAYGDWTRAGDYSRSLTQHAIHMVQRNLTPGGDKNGADINLALDALEMAFTHSHINTFVIVSGDSDFMALVEKLKQYDRKVLVVGGRAFTSQILQKNCHEFIAYENLVGRRAGPRGRPQQDTPLTGAVTLVRRALKVLTDREVSPQLGVLKSTLLQLDPTFSEREYGASTFRDLVQRLDRAGYVTLKGTDRNLYVELREGTEGAHAPRDPEPASAIAATPESMPERVAEPSAAPEPPPPPPAPTRREEPIEPDSQLAILPAPMLASEPDLDELDAAAYAAAHGMPPPRPQRRDGRDGRDGRGGRDGGRDNRGGDNRGGDNRGGENRGGDGRRGGPAGPPAPPADPALQGEGYKAMERVFLKPGAVTRWPLYLRQAKAVLRAGDEGFDERKYGFAGLVEALRFGQREGLFRLDRDRQGVLRVYPGQLLQRADGSLMPGVDVAPAHREPAASYAAAPPAAVEEPEDVAEPIEEAAPIASIEDAPAPAAKAPKKRAGAAKKPAAAKKAAAPKARAAKAAAPKKRAAKKAD